MASFTYQMLSVWLAAAVVLQAAAQAPLPDLSLGDNCIVFPNRDFVNCEGYARFVGRGATVRVLRAGAVVGATDVMIAVDGTGVAFEVNHPGGVCWGAGNPANPQVTPNIVGGDVVELQIVDGPTNAVTVGGAQVTAINPVSDLEFTVSGTLGGLTPDQIAGRFLELRIVNPDLEAFVGRRDIRATDATLTDQGNGYASELVLDPAALTFVARFVFNANLAAARATAQTGGGARIMSWQASFIGERVGLTIAEFGEVDGPGFGGCPAGPADVLPPVGQNAFFTAVGGTVTVQWGEAVAQPGAPAVVGYRISMLQVMPPGVQAPIIGVQTPAADRRAVLQVDPGTPYTLEVRAVVEGDVLGPRYTIVDPTVGGGGGAPPTPTLPSISIDTTSATGSGTPPDPFLTNALVVTVTPSTAACFYTTTSDGTIPPPPVDATFAVDPSARPCGASIPITAAVSLMASALTREGLVASLGQVVAVAPISLTRLPLQPQTLTVAPLSGAARLTWVSTGAPVPFTPPADFLIRRYTTADGGATFSLDAAFGQTAPGTATSADVLSQPGGQLVAFTVEPRYADEPKLGAVSAESARVSVTPIAADDIFLITKTDYRIGDRLRVSGSVNRYVEGNQVSLQCKQGFGPLFPLVSLSPLSLVPSPFPGGADSGDFDLEIRPPPFGITECVVTGKGGFTNGIRDITGASNPILL